MEGIMKGARLLEAEAAEAAKQASRRRGRTS